MNLQIRSPLNDVLVSDDVTSRINNEAGAETLQGLANFAWTNTIVAKELRVNILKRIAHGSLDHALGVDIDDCRQDLCHGQHGRFRSGIGLRKTGCPPCKGQQCSDQRAMRVSGEHTRPRVQRSAPSPSAPSAKQTAQGVFGEGAENATRGAGALQNPLHHATFISPRHKSLDFPRSHIRSK